jgi:porphobilinogen synthase
MREATLTRGRLAEHPVWSRALQASDLAGRTILPAIVASSVEDREKVDGAGWIERLSLTEVVREARSAAAAGLAGLLLFGVSDRKDEHALLASEPDHVVPRAIRAIKEAVPELGVATDVCVCAYTAHGQCVLFGERGADVPATLERLAAIARVHADAGADLLIPSGMLETTVRFVRDALAAAGRADLPVAGLVKLESALYATHRSAVQAIPIAERAVPLIPADDAAAAVTRARRDMAEGADVVVVKPGAPGLDIVARLAAFADRPLLSYFTADEHGPFVAAVEGALDPAAAEREHLAAARRAGASLVISSGAWSVAES